MKLRQVTAFLRSRTARLAASYLTIIMGLSLTFSYILYKISEYELGREIPPSGLFRLYGPDLDYGYRYFFERRIEEARGHLLGRLIILNLFVLVIGGALSYYLARRTLRPIEHAMEAQNRFVADASHELRTPLTALLTSNEVASRKPGLTLKQAKAVIKSNTEEIVKLKGLTDALLSLASGDSVGLGLRFQAVSLQDIAKEAMNRVLPAAQAKNISVQDDVPDVSVNGDPAKLTQALTILLDNAIKYSPDKATINLSAKTKDGHAGLSVKDSGIGIAAKDLPRIFDRFYRADPARSKPGADGYGIGLSIAKQITEHHHGRITVSSAPGKGSTFTIQLPLAPKPKR